MAGEFIVGDQYTREQVAELELPASRRASGTWMTGYDQWDGAIFIFANVGVAGRTGIQARDYSYHKYACIRCLAVSRLARR